MDQSVGSRKTDVEADQEYNFQDKRGIWCMHVNRVLGSATACLSQKGVERQGKDGRRWPPGFTHRADTGMKTLHMLRD